MNKLTAIATILCFFVGTVFSITDGVYTGPQSISYYTDTFNGKICAGRAVCPMTCTFSGPTMSCVRPQCSVGSATIDQSALGGTFSQSGNNLNLFYGGSNFCIKVEERNGQIEYAYDGITGACPSTFSATCNSVNGVVTSQIVTGTMTCMSGECTTSAGVAVYPAVMMVIAFIGAMLLL